MIKKLLVLFFLFLICPNSSFSKNYKEGDIIEGVYEWSSKLSYPLPEGKWKVLADSYDSWECNIDTRYTLLGKVKNNTIVEAIKFEIIHSMVKCTWVLDHYIEDWVFDPDPDKDNCFDKKNYFYIKVKKNGNRGWAHNCFIVSHFDPSLPKKDWETEDYALLSKLKKNYKIPPIILGSRHYFYSRSTIQKWFGIEYFILPEFFSYPGSKVGEKQSEYHINNINNHPKHKVAMNKWLEISKKRHVQLENFVNAKNNFKLNLGIAKHLDKKNQSKLTDELDKLNELYKSGILTKEEFSKAKRKLLN